MISMSIAKIASNYDDEKSIGSRFRSARIQPFLDLVQGYYEKNGRVNVIDVGGMRNYWNIVPSGFLEDHNVSVTIVNLAAQQKPINDSTFTFVEGDACNLLNFKENEFDIAHSNSVVEHVGDWEKMKAYGGEIRRVAKSYFVQTPSYWFPIEPHFMRPFFHWLPKPVRVSWVKRTAVGHFPKAQTVDEAVSTVESARLLDKKMFRALFPDAELIHEKVALLTKSYIAVKK